MAGFGLKHLIKALRIHLSRWQPLKIIEIFGKEFYIILWLRLVQNLQSPVNAFWLYSSFVIVLHSKVLVFLEQKFVIPLES